MSILNYIFTVCVACKNLVRNRQKIQFVELDFSKEIFQNYQVEKDWANGSNNFTAELFIKRTLGNICLSAKKLQRLIYEKRMKSISFLKIAINFKS